MSAVDSAAGGSRSTALRRAQQYAARVCRILLRWLCAAASSAFRPCLSSQLLE